MEDKDFYTTAQAAKVLRVSDAYIRQMLLSGELEGSHDVGGRWRIPARAVHARLEERRSQRSSPTTADIPSGESPQAAQERRELQERVEDLTRQLGRLEGRLELTQTTESTLREQLMRERERADQERARVEELQRELEHEREARTRASRPWWRRLLRSRHE